MDDYKIILKKQTEILPKKMRDYLINGDWENNLENVLANFSLEEYQKISIGNETFFVLIGLEPCADLSQNISKEAEIDSNMAEWISDSIIKNIIDPAIEKFGEEDKDATENSMRQNQNKVGQSFEQIILNQAKAMQPASAAPEPSGEGGSGYSEAKPTQAPENLPTESDKPKAIHNYIPGSDPYREPLE